MKDSNHTHLTSASSHDRESWARPDDTLDLRLWLRMLTCHSLVENQIRGMMRTRFNTTLPRFDLMAQLAAAPGGMKMTDLSRCMMVTNGNITGIADQLESDGLVERIKVETDRRTCLVRLTAKGRQSFRRMSAAYQDQLSELFQILPENRRELLYELLAELKEASLTALETVSASHQH